MSRYTPSGARWRRRTGANRAASPPVSSACSNRAHDAEILRARSSTASAISRSRRSSASAIARSVSASSRTIASAALRTTFTGCTGKSSWLKTSATIPPSSTSSRRAGGKPRVVACTVATSVAETPASLSSRRPAPSETAAAMASPTMTASCQTPTPMTLVSRSPAVIPTATPSISSMAHCARWPRVRPTRRSRRSGRTRDWRARTRCWPGATPARPLPPSGRSAASFRAAAPALHARQTAARRGRVDELTTPFAAQPLDGRTEPTQRSAPLVPTRHLPSATRTEPGNTLTATG